MTVLSHAVKQYKKLKFLRCSQYIQFKSPIVSKNLTQEKSNCMYLGQDCHKDLNLQLKIFCFCVCVIQRFFLLRGGLVKRNSRGFLIRTKHDFITSANKIQTNV
jgi:hypothetical protein